MKSQPVKPPETGFEKYFESAFWHPPSPFPSPSPNPFGKYFETLFWQRFASPPRRSAPHHPATLGPSPHTPSTLPVDCLVLQEN